MRNMLAFFAAMLLTVAGVGWYLGWYTIRSSPTTGGQRSVTVDINTRKIGQDLRAAEERIQQELAERSRKRQKEKATGAPPEPKSWFGIVDKPADRGEKAPEPAPFVSVDRP